MAIFTEAGIKDGIEDGIKDNTPSIYRLYLALQTTRHYYLCD